MSMVADLARNWTAILIRGAAAVILGLILLFWPGITLLTIIFAFGIFVLVEGASALATSLRRREGQGINWWLLILGLIGIAAGIATFVWPAITGLILLYVIGFWAIAAGITEIATGIAVRREVQGEWLLILTGIVSLFFGLIVVVAPGAGALALAFFIGFFALIYGVLQLALAFRLRRLAEQGMQSR